MDATITDAVYVTIRCATNKKGFNVSMSLCTPDEELDIPANRKADVTNGTYRLTKNKIFDRVNFGLQKN